MNVYKLQPNKIHLTFKKNFSQTVWYFCTYNMRSPIPGFQTGAKDFQTLDGSKINGGFSDAGLKPLHVLQYSQSAALNYMDRGCKNPRNPFIRLIRDADKKGRNTDELDYADCTDFQCNLQPFLPTLRRTKPRRF